ncbi:hypothetical protein ISS30_07520 [bacterium]|nr:hypothetical protein [bacterium]
MKVSGGSWEKILGFLKGEEVFMEGEMAEMQAGLVERMAAAALVVSLTPQIIVICQAGL